MVRIVNAREVVRRAAAVLPVIALVTTGVALAAGASPWGAGSDRGGVPDEALTTGASPPYPSVGPAPAPMQLPPVYSTFSDEFARVPVPGVAEGVVRAIGALAPVRLDTHGIPGPALAAYHQAADLLGSLDPACGLDWALLGAIGRVESNHSRFGGNSLDLAGIARPGIIGIPLDGRRGTARITDTDGGRWDRDRAYDRAVGPMQFIPGTWRVSGRDGDRDGTANPQSMVDAATAAGTYLCAGQGDLRSRDGAYSAVLRSNHSDDYARSVLSIAEAYRSGVTVVPMGSIPAARPAAGSGTETPEGSGFGWGGSSAAPSASPSSSRGTEPAAQPSPAAQTTRDPGGRPSSPVPASPRTAPKPSRPALPAPGLPLPATAPLPVPVVPVPTSTSLGVEELLALPHLSGLPGDPAGLVRVLSPLTGQVVCLLDKAVVACP